MTSPNPPARHPIIHLLTRMLVGLLIVSMGILVIDVLWGVLSRMLASWGVLASQSSWTEELARFLMIWVGMLGACLAFEQKAHLGVDFFVGKLHPAGQKILRLATFSIVLVFAIGVLVIGGWELVSRTLALKQDTPALGIPKGWVYLAVPISGVFTVIFTIGHMMDVCRSDYPQPQDAGEATS